MTVLQAKYDILERLSVTSDDGDISERLVGQWLGIARNLIVKSWLESNSPPASMLKMLTIQISTNKITLPVKVYDLKDDGGILTVSRPGGKLIDMIDGGVGGLHLEMNSLVGAPSEFWYRVGQDIILEGKFPKDIKIDVVLLPSEIESFDDNDAFPAPSELEALILEEAEKIGNRKTRRPHDIDNDGKDQPNE
jgi:hypothetical protein